MQVKLRGESMQAAADAADSSMVSVIGLDSEKVQEICDAVNERVGAGSVQIANFLCPGNYVISGSSEVPLPAPLAPPGFCPQGSVLSEVFSSEVSRPVRLCCVSRQAALVWLLSDYAI